jgi:hypothetical protein
MVSLSFRPELSFAGPWVSRNQARFGHQPLSLLISPNCTLARLNRHAKVIKSPGSTILVSGQRRLSEASRIAPVIKTPNRDSVQVFRHDQMNEIRSRNHPVQSVDSAVQPPMVVYERFGGANCNSCASQFSVAGRDPKGIRRSLGRRSNAKAPENSPKSRHLPRSSSVRPYSSVAVGARPHSRGWPFLPHTAPRSPPLPARTQMCAVAYPDLGCGRRKAASGSSARSLRNSC